MPPARRSHIGCAARNGGGTSSISIRSHDKRFQTANEIHIPVGRNVRFELEGDDVIHSFWVPSLAGKQDLIPGRHERAYASRRSAGVYRGQCAEFCGLQHAHMAFLVDRRDAGSYSTHGRTRSAGRAASAPPMTRSQAGRDVFLAKPCAACHTVRGTPAAGTTGPDLTHVGGRSIHRGRPVRDHARLARGLDRRSADAQARQQHADGAAHADELRAISAYMASLK